MTRSRGHQIALKGITQRFNDFVAVADANFEVERGQLLALLGPSGCGKSTLLRIMSGFVRQTAGEVLFDGQSVDHLPPSRRGVGIVFQNYALFPHMTVAENVAYGLQAQRWPRSKISARVDDMLALVHMSEFHGRKPRELSGGQQQRIALARCLAVDPKVLLLDEPFGALDKNLRLDMQLEVKRLVREAGVTTILVTHDQEEALSMADRVAVMSRGRIEQIGTPAEIYDRPKTLFINQFVGATNTLRGTFSTHGTAASVVLENGLALPVAMDSGFTSGTPVIVSVRPEQLQFRDADGMVGTLKAIMPLGSHIIYEIELPGNVALKVSERREHGSDMRRSGDTVRIAPRSRDVCRIYPLS